MGEPADAKRTRRDSKFYDGSRLQPAFPPNHFHLPVWGREQLNRIGPFVEREHFLDWAGYVRGVLERHHLLVRCLSARERAGYL